MLTRRRLGHTFGLGVTAGLLAAALPGLALATGEPELSDDGLYVQDWFLDSFLDLPEDLAEAAEEGRHFAIVWEQRGCPYCRELHRVNFARKDIRSYVQANFTILQLNLWGSREVVDFDGEALEERNLARKWAVNFTPTIMFFSQDPANSSGVAGHHAEVARMPGYFKPFHFMAMFEFVAEGHYQEMGFQRYLQDKFAELRAQGIDPEVW